MLTSIGRASVLVLAVLWTSGAAAQPSPSCAARFVGSWMVTVTATGQTYPAVISPGGTTHVTCPFCNPTGTWTCSGNQIFILAPTPTSHTISADNRTMSGGCCTAVRVGPAPSVAGLQRGRQAAPQPATGASRWLPPGSPNAEPAPAPVPRNPFGGDIHMGNRPVNDPGPRIVQPGQRWQGLSGQRRSEIDRLRGDRRALERYLNRLPARERQVARNYASTTTTTTTNTGGGLTCARSLREQLRIRMQTGAEIPRCDAGGGTSGGGTGLRDCLRARLAGLSPPAHCGQCQFRAGCNERTCAFHLQVLRNWGPPRLTPDQVVTGMQDVGCGRWAPRA